MAGYFSYFNKIAYSLDENPNKNVQYITNILQRSRFLKEITDNTAAYYPYQMKEGDTAEIIADKLYGDSTRHWIVLLFNKILNPFYEFPLSDSVLDSYIQSKYGYTSDQASNVLHHYEERIQRTNIYNGVITDQHTDTYIVSEYSVNYSTNSISLRSLPEIGTSLDVGTETIQLDNTGNLFVQNKTTIHAISVFEYEFNLNEDRREIKLLDKKYVASVEQEFKKLMSDG